jgi:5'-nucleotidase
MTRVLLTNDDGVEAAGLAASVEAMLAAGHEVVVVAPSGNRSATGHHVTVRTPLELLLVEQDERLQVWSCSGTPADCVRSAQFEGSVRRFDVVVSGLNHGVNLGEDILYSGTFAAAAEAALLGYPAIAASQAGAHADPGFLSERPVAFPFAGYLARAAEALTRVAGAEGIVLNVNLPATLSDPVARACSLGARDWRGSAMRTRPRDGGVVVEDAWAIDPPPLDIEGSDFAELVRGHATVTALRVRRGIVEDPALWTALHSAGFPMDVETGTEDAA